MLKRTQIRNRRKKRRSIERLEQRDLLAADLNGDALFNAQDIDALFAAIRTGSTDPAFDINGDDQVSSADFEAYQKPSHGNFIAGDVNLDNDVNFEDFLAMSANFGAAGGWGQGDMNGDGNVGFPDFLLLSDNFGRSSTRTVTFTYVDGGFGAGELFDGATLKISDRIGAGPNDYSEEIVLDGSEPFTVEVPNIPIFVQAQATDPNDPFCFFSLFESVTLEQDNAELLVLLACA